MLKALIIIGIILITLRMYLKEHMNFKLDYYSEMLAYIISTAILIMLVIKFIE